MPLKKLSDNFDGGSQPTMGPLNRQREPYEHGKLIHILIDAEKT